MTRRHQLTLVILPALLFAAIVLPMAMAWSDLPDSIATHWGIDGKPNGHMPPMALLLFIGGIFVAVWMAVTAASRRMAFEARSFISGLAGIGGLLAAVQWISLEANRGVADWTEAAPVEGFDLIIVFVVAIAAGVLGWIVAGAPAPVPGTDRSAESPLLAVEPGTSPVWSGRGRGTVLIIIGIGLLGAAVVMWSVVSLVLVVAAVVVLLFAEVRATVSQRGVVVALGWLGIPSRLLPLETITGADVEDVSPMSYGGWGYRVRPGTRGIIVRGGPSLRLHRNDRPDLVITVEDAERGAALVNALVARTRA